MTVTLKAIKAQEREIARRKTQLLNDKIVYIRECLKEGQTHRRVAASLDICERSMRNMLSDAKLRDEEEGEVCEQPKRITASDRHYRPQW